MEKIVKPQDNLQQICDNLNHGDTLILSEGVYFQKVVLSTSDVTILGSGKSSTVIEFDDCANKIHADGKEFNTFRTSTVAVCASNVTFKNLTIKNSTKNPQANGQCVALSVVGDNFKMENCKLVSTQDTLFCGPLPDDLVVRYIDFLPKHFTMFEGQAKQEFFDCEIFGSVDFIFGCGNAVFDNCRIVSVNDGRQVGFVAAPAHSLKQVDGFAFLSCIFDAEQNVLDGSVFLARPWRDFGKCEFFDCKLGKHINKKLFSPWGDTNRDKTARFLIHDNNQHQKGYK